ncbi:MAG: hypothetical protein RL538_583 [Candidatus Parcubacteria bacterium]|jgi:hypothetical protein
MEAVIFDGKEYIKASVLAEKFRYTADYLGQLCRGKKVDARLVGRAWYINLESLNQHRDTRYKAPLVQPKVSLEPRSVEAQTKKPSNHYLSRIDVEPVLKNKTVKIFREKGGSLSEFSVKYERDEYSLIPKVNKTAVSASLPIVPADAESLKVPKGPREFRITDFKAELPPEVYLSGKVRIEGIPEPVAEASQIDTESSDMSTKIKVEQPLGEPKSSRTVSVRPKHMLKSKGFADIKPAHVSVPVHVSESIKSAETTVSQETEHHFHSKNLPKVTVQEKSLGKRKQELRIDSVDPIEKIPSPHTVSYGSHSTHVVPPVTVPSFLPRSEQEKSEALVESVPVSLWLPMLSLIGALVVAFLLVATELELTIRGGLYADRLTIETATLVTFFDTFFH